MTTEKRESQTPQLTPAEADDRLIRVIQDKVDKKASAEAVLYAAADLAVALDTNPHDPDVAEYRLDLRTFSAVDARDYHHALAGQLRQHAAEPTDSQYPKLLKLVDVSGIDARARDYLRQAITLKTEGAIPPGQEILQIGYRVLNMPVLEPLNDYPIDYKDYFRQIQILEALFDYLELGLRTLPLDANYFKHLLTNFWTQLIEGRAEITEPQPEKVWEHRIEVVQTKADLYWIISDIARLNPASRINKALLIDLANDKLDSLNGKQSDRRAAHNQAQQFQQVKELVDPQLEEHFAKRRMAAEDVDHYMTRVKAFLSSRDSARGIEIADGLKVPDNRIDRLKEALENLGQEGIIGWEPGREYFLKPDLETPEKVFSNLRNLISLIDQADAQAHTSETEPKPQDIAPKLLELLKNPDESEWSEQYRDVTDPNQARISVIMDLINNLAKLRGLSPKAADTIQNQLALDQAVVRFGAKWAKAGKVKSEAAS